MTTNEMIGLRIKNRRMELGMSQMELAKKLGYSSRSMISFIESGQRALDINQIGPLTKALDCTVSDIVDGEADTRQEIIDILDSLTPDQMSAALNFLQVMIEGK